jgi:hypothetical protein
VTTPGLAETSDKLKVVAVSLARTGVRVGRRSRSRALRPLLLRNMHAPRDVKVDGAAIFWIPEAGVGPHLAAMEMLARTMTEAGHSAVFVRCYEGFCRCPVMDMYQLADPSPQREARSCCDRCLYNSVRMLDRYRLPAIDLSGWLDLVRPQVDALTDVRPHDLSEFRHDDVPFGTLALHDLTLVHKLATFEEVPSNLEDAWWARIKSCLTAYLLVSEIIRGGRPSELVHFNDGALNVSARLAAERAGIPCRSVAFASHVGVDRRRIVITKTIAHDALLKHASQWERWRDLPISRQMVETIGDDVVRHFTNAGGASHIYSRGFSAQPASMHQSLGLSAGRRVLVAYTSSLDEDNAARAYRKALGIDDSIVGTSPFRDQLDWLRQLADAVTLSTDMQLIIRVHPREDANDREGVASEHLRLLRREFTDKQDHVRVVWPREPVSSYDLARIAHVVLVSWSSIGLELARAALPVLATSVGTFHGLPRNDGVAWEPTAEAYFERLRELCENGTALDDVIFAYRFYAMRQLALSTDLGDVARSAGTRGLPRWRIPAESRRILAALADDLDPGEDTLDRLTRERSPASEDLERSAVRGQMRRIFGLVTTGRDVRSGPDLHLAQTGDSASQPDSPAFPGAVVVSGDTVWFSMDGCWSTVTSPMAARLALFGCSKQVREAG